MESSSIAAVSFPPAWLKVFLRIPTIFLTLFLTVSGNLIFEARENSLCSYTMDDDGSLGEASCFLEDLSFTVGIDVDVRDRILFFSDINEGTIRRVSIADGVQPVEQIFHGLGSVEDIAVDWLSRNIYWTDFQLGHICAARYDGSRRAILITNQQGPRSIVVHPARGYVFWTNVGDTLTPGSIGRAGLNGDDQRVLVSTGLSSPNGLAIDFPSNRLYFADRGTEMVESVKLSGAKRELVYEAESADFFDMTILGGYLFTTRWSGSDVNGYITAVEYPATELSSYIEFVPTVIEIDQHNGKALGITTFDESRQKLKDSDGNGVCGSDNGGCDHLCMPVSSEKYKCVCATGYILDDDDVSCKTDLVDRNFILFADSSLSTIFQRYINDAGESVVSAVDLERVMYPVDLAFDPVEEKVYWTDRLTKSVNRAHLHGSGYEIVTALNIDDPSGIDLDVLRRQVFWIDEGKKTINVIDMDLTGQRVVIDGGLDEPRALTVNPLSGEIFWTDWGQTAKIEKARMDGSERKTIASSGLGWPNGIAIDVQSQEIFWCDAQNDIIETSDFEGNNRRVLTYLDDTAHPFGLTVSADRVFWSDWTTRALYGISRMDVTDVQRLSDDDVFLRLQGMCLSTVSYPLDANITTIAPDVIATSAGDNPVPSDDDPFTSVNVVVLIAAAVGGGLGFLAIIFIATLIVCKCNNGSNTRSLDSHRARESHAMANIPLPPYSGKAVSQTPLPQSKLQPQESRREKGDHIYEDLDGYRDGYRLDFDSDAYLNPTFDQDGGAGGEYTGLRSTACKLSYTSASGDAYLDPNVRRNASPQDSQQPSQHGGDYLDLSQSRPHPPGHGSSYMNLQAKFAQKQQNPRQSSSPQPSKTSVSSMSNLWPPSSPQSTQNAPRPPASPRPSKTAVMTNWPPEQVPRTAATRPLPSLSVADVTIPPANLEYQSTHADNDYLSYLRPAPRPPSQYESSMNM